MSFLFYLGVHRPAWLRSAEVPLFVSVRQLAPYKTLPRAAARWALDSGGFTELNAFGRWMRSPAQYATEAKRFADDVGRLDWAAVQDWMVEPSVLKKTGLNVREHQRRTIENYEDLLSLSPEFPWAPVLQGWTADDYLRHRDDYIDRGHALTLLPIVGIGSVCRRQQMAEITQVIARFHSDGIKLHAFGFKATGLKTGGSARLASSDSMAWSFHARKNPGDAINHLQKHANCANCLEYALLWRQRLLGGL